MPRCRTLVSIFNDAWSDNWGLCALHPGRDRPCLQGFRPVIVPNSPFFVDVDDESVAFIVALTNLYEAVEEFGGKLGPINSPSSCGG